MVNQCSIVCVFLLSPSNCKIVQPTLQNAMCTLLKSLEKFSVCNCETIRTMVLKIETRVVYVQCPPKLRFEIVSFKFLTFFGGGSDRHAFAFMNVETRHTIQHPFQQENRRGQSRSRPHVVHQMVSYTFDK